MKQIKQMKPKRPRSEGRLARKRTNLKLCFEELQREYHNLLLERNYYRGEIGKALNEQADLKKQLAMADAYKRILLDENLKLQSDMRSLAIDRDYYKSEALAGGRIINELRAERDALAKRNKELEAQLLRSAQEPISTIMQMGVEKW